MYRIRNYLSARLIVGTLPNNIQNGQAEDAVPVMANLNWIINQVNANAQPLGLAALLAAANSFTQVQSGIAATSAANFPIATQVQNRVFNTLTSTLGTNTITARNAALPLSAYAVGQIFSFIPSNTSTGAVALNIDGLGSGAVQVNGASLSGGEIQNSRYSEVFVSQVSPPIFQLIGGPQVATAINVKQFGAKGDGIADDTAAIQRAINSRTSGGVVFVPLGIYKISSTLTVGDGSASAASTVNYISLVGEGAGTASSEAAPGGATQILWAGSASGTMIQVKGPISSVRIEGMILNCNSLANTGLDLIHPFNSVIRNVKTHLYKGFAYKITAFTSVSGVAIGANSNIWEGVFAENPASGGSGIQVGAAASVPGDLDVAKNSWTNCQFISDGTSATSYSLELRFVDNCSFVETTFSRQGGTSSFGIKVSPPTGNTGFPGSILFLNCAVFGITGSGWTGTTRGLIFIPYLTGDSEAVPTQNFAWGITDQGLWFGDLSAQRVSWTPVISGDSTAGTQTYSNQNGRVTKIGNMYFAEFRVTMTAKDAATAGNIFISGFPGTPTATGGGGSIASYSNVDLAVGYSQLSLHNSGGVMYLKQGGDNITSSFVAAAAIAATTEIIGTFMYSV
jgi:hypothetical protein